MQTNPAVVQNNNIKWSVSPWNQSGRKGKGLWRKWKSLDAILAQYGQRVLRTYSVTAGTETIASDYSILISSSLRLLVFNFTAGRFIDFINLGGLCLLQLFHIRPTHNHMLLLHWALYVRYTLSPSREWVSGSWVMGQMGRQMWMGHVGHGSVL